MKGMCKKCGISPARQVAAVAVVTALLIGGQLALSAVAGVEIVTVLLLCFSWVYGARSGMLAAAAFSLLRCFIWGFYPSAMVLYLIYYPLFALVFGVLGRGGTGRFARLPIWAAVLVDVVIAAVGAGAAFCAATSAIKISRLAAVMVKSLLWVVFGLCCALFAVFNTFFILQKRGALKDGRALALAVAASLAAFFTVCFTLLDDVITPLFMGWGLFSESAALYFYTSFLALAPQTVCAIVSVCLLFFPLTSLFLKSAKQSA